MYLIPLGWMDGLVPTSVLNNVIVVCIASGVFAEAWCFCQSVVFLPKLIRQRSGDFIHPPTYHSRSTSTLTVSCYVGIGSGRFAIRGSRDRQGS
jgi:hypothetical protein